MVSSSYSYRMIIKCFLIDFAGHGDVLIGFIATNNDQLASSITDLLSGNNNTCIIIAIISECY